MGSRSDGVAGIDEEGKADKHGARLIMTLRTRVRSILGLVDM